MSESQLDIEFKKAFEIASNMEQDSVPQDIMLRLYAYYKQASFGALSSFNYSNLDVRDAFKMNAWLQISQISETEAKQEYINLVNELIKSKK